MTDREKRQLTISYRKQTITVLENLLSKMDVFRFQFDKDSDFYEESRQATEFYAAIWEFTDTLKKMNEYSMMILNKEG